MYHLRLENLAQNKTIIGYLVKVEQRRGDKVPVTRYEVSDSLLYPKFNRPVLPLGEVSLPLNSSALDEGSEIYAEVEAVLYSDGSTGGKEESIQFLRQRRLQLRGLRAELAGKMEIARETENGYAGTLAELVQRKAQREELKPESPLVGMMNAALIAELRAIEDTLKTNDASTLPKQQRLLSEVARILRDQNSKLEQ
jgi:hypothetical protein